MAIFGSHFKSDTGEGLMAEGRYSGYCERVKTGGEEACDSARDRVRWGDREKHAGGWLKDKGGFFFAYVLSQATANIIIPPKIHSSIRIEYVLR